MGQDSGCRRKGGLTSEGGHAAARRSLLTFGKDPAGPAGRRRAHFIMGILMPFFFAQAMAARVSGIGVTDDAQARIDRQDALQPAAHHGRAVGDDDHAGVER